MSSQFTIRSFTIAATLLGAALAPVANAAVVTITGFGIGDGVNGGAGGFGGLRTFNNFFGTTNQFFVMSNRFGKWGMNGESTNIQVATLGTSTTAPNPMAIGGGATIGASLNWVAGDPFSGNASLFRASSGVASDFGPGSFIAFRSRTDVNTWFYGYFEVTWNSTTNEFFILSGAYESVANTAISTPIQIPGGAGLVACAALGAARRRRR